MFEKEPAAHQLPYAPPSTKAPPSVKAPPAPSSAQGTAAPTAVASQNIFGSLSDDPPPVAIAPKRRRSSTGHSRRASVQNSDPFAFLPEPTSSSSRRSSAISEGSVDMDLESEAGDDDYIAPAPTGLPFTPLGILDVEDDDPWSFGATPSGPAIRSQSPNGSSGEDDDESEADISLDGMDETQAMGGILGGASADVPPTITVASPAPEQLSPSASTQSGGHSDDDMDDIVEDSEDKTMDFTVATGGIIPTAAPATAQFIRGSVGYSIEAEEAERMSAWSRATAGSLASSAAARAAAAAEEEMRWDNDDDTTGFDAMEITRAMGGILRTAGTDGDDTGSEMDMTRVGGGILAPSAGSDADDSDLSGDHGAVDMDTTVAFGGLIFPVNLSAAASNDDTDEDRDDQKITVARGGIFTQSSGAGGNQDATEDEEEGIDMDVTVACGGIIASAARRTSTSAPRPSVTASPRKPSSFPTPTRPLSSSLTRPTASSAAKAKATPRNLFDSPVNLLVPTLSKGNKIGASPAKRLIFGAPSPAKSPARKRAAEEMDSAHVDVFGSAPSPKRRASSRGTSIEVDVLGSLAGSSAVTDTLSSPTSSSKAKENIFGSYEIQEPIFIPQENPPSPQKRPSLGSARAVEAVAAAPVASPFRAANTTPPAVVQAPIFGEAVSASPVASSVSPAPTVNIFASSPIAEQQTAAETPAEVATSLDPAEERAIADQLAPSTTPLSPRLPSGTTPKKKLGRPSLVSLPREPEVDNLMVEDEAVSAALCFLLSTIAHVS